MSAALHEVRPWDEIITNRVDGFDAPRRRGAAINVTLPPELEGFARERVESGHYGASAEVVRDALLQERERRLDELPREIQAGFGSGPTTPLDFAALRATARAMLARGPCHTEPR
jgi:putative addiction module CopG family antidote